MAHRKKFKTILSEVRQVFPDAGLKEVLVMLNDGIDDLCSKYNLKSDIAQIDIKSGKMHYYLGELGPHHKVRKIWRVDYINTSGSYREIARCVNARHITQWDTE